MVVKEYDYIKGNAALNPKRKTVERDRKKNQDIQKLRKNKARKLIEEKKKNRKAVMQIAVFIVLMGILTIFRDAHVFTMQSNLTKVNNEIKVVQAENEALKVDLLKASSLDNIKNTAETMGMTLATKDNIVTVDISENYFQELDDRDAKLEKENERSFFDKILDVLNF